MALFAQGGTPVFVEVAKAGTYIFTAPISGRYFAVVVAAGGGGAGGTTNARAGGGGGGGERRAGYINLTANTAYTLTVGAAGTAGTAADNGGTGGTSSIDALITAVGGDPGLAATSAGGRWWNGRNRR
jgi:hypothetical protein